MKLAYNVTGTMISTSIPQKRILALTIVENPSAQRQNPLVRKEVYDFWQLCKTSMTQNCNGRLASRPDLSQHADLFMIKDSQTGLVLFAFRVFTVDSLDAIPPEAFDADTIEALKHGYFAVDYVKFHPSTENNQAQRHLLFEMFLGSLYHYCLDQGIRKLVTTTTHSTFANQIILRFGFDMKPGKSILYLNQFLPGAHYLGEKYNEMWRARKLVGT